MTREEFIRDNFNISNDALDLLLSLFRHDNNERTLITILSDTSFDFTYEDVIAILRMEEE